MHRMVVFPHNNGQEPRSSEPALRPGELYVLLWNPCVPASLFVGCTEKLFPLLLRFYLQSWSTSFLTGSWKTTTTKGEKDFVTNRSVKNVQRRYSAVSSVFTRCSFAAATAPSLCTSVSVRPEHLHAAVVPHRLCQAARGRNRLFSRRSGETSLESLSDRVELLLWLLVLKCPWTWTWTC